MNARISGLRKFASARFQILLIVKRFTSYVSAHDLMAPRCKFISASPGLTAKSNMETMFLLCSDVRSRFLPSTGGGSTAGSGSGGSMVMSYSLNSAVASVLYSKNSILSIQTRSPIFHVIHAWIALFELYTNDMTFWENARCSPN